MAYSTDEDLLNEFTNEELARITGDSTGQTIDSDRLSYARSNADALIDSYLYGRYNVPFQSPIDPIIKKMSLDLTVVNLYEYAYRNTILPNAVSWRKIYAMKLLKDLQSGIVSLQNVTSGVNAPPPIISNKSGGERYFDKEAMDKFWSKQ